MINILKDIVQILSSLSLVDYILYFAVVALIVLIAALIYVIEAENEEMVFNEEKDNNKELNMCIKK